MFTTTASQLQAKETWLHSEIAMLSCCLAELEQTCTPPPEEALLMLTLRSVERPHLNNKQMKCV